MDEITFDLPRDDDQLFRPGVDWNNNACLNPFWPEWELYIIGYRDCANLLVEEMKEGQVLQDAPVFPEPKCRVEPDGVCPGRRVCWGGVAVGGYRLVGADTTSSEG